MTDSPVLPEAHVIPIDDVIEHESTDDCICGPRCEFVKGGIIFTHNTLDTQKGIEMKFKNGDKVVDKTRVKLWGNTQGTVLSSVGPYRCRVKWPDDRGTQIEKNIDLEKGKIVSQHIVEDGKFKFVFGWDQPLQSFYLQKHDLSLPEEKQIVAWIGTGDTVMYEVEDLVRSARILGLHIDSGMQTRLYGEKDDGS